jgi:predicted nucleic acid-binding protein
LSVTEWRAVNTSPLIYLSRSGLLDLLKADAQRVVVPQAVADEIFAWPSADAAQVALKTVHWLELAPPEPISRMVLAWDLGAGESAVLAYGQARAGVTLVLDDLAARRCAAAIGAPVRGTLGLVLRAKRKGSLTSARAALDALRDAGMYLSESIREAALREVGE